ncbi:MAG: tRNA (N6-threonylcarbamoyladenosine(37)-N6)-methyltransferase TrmO [Candidatus Eisenbacteria bacterium]|nr:tRNA (N6-threonylcarbamoyladenosine(37)-N6)-methyltransferase TrmO [Candidatus Eisenbacteria bacterium]
MRVTYESIGVARSPFHTMAETPRQPRVSDVEGTIEIDEAFAEGLKDIEGFSHIWVIFHAHRADFHQLLVKPYLDDRLRGVFACRAPRRPNPIGLSLLRLLGREGSVLRVSGMDLLDGTPILDIKPHVPEFDHEAGARIGWLEGKEIERLDEERD